MSHFICPWWGGYFIDNRFRRWIHNPERILEPHVKPGMTAMDFGCGMGMFSIALARLVGTQGRVISVDLQQRMLDVLRRRAKKAGILDRIRLHRCEPNAIGLDASVDFALAFYSAHEVPDLRRLFAEVRRLLKLNGRFLVVEPIGHVTARNFQAMLSLAEEIGLHEQGRPHVCLGRAAVLAKS